MKKLIKILPILMIVLVLSTFAVPVYAAKGEKSAGDLVNEFKPNDDPTGADSVKTLGQNVLGIIRLVGILISIAILMVLGIKYMMGSAEEKAEYKKTFIPYLVGAILLFAASAIATTIIEMAFSVDQSLSEGTSTSKTQDDTP